MSNYPYIDLQVGLSVENWKSFGKRVKLFEKIKNINIIIGKNNSGKSAIIDVLEFLCENDKEIDKKFYRDNKKSSIYLYCEIDKNLIPNYFSTYNANLQSYHPDVNNLTGIDIAQKYFSEHKFEWICKKAEIFT